MADPYRMLGDETAGRRIPEMVYTIVLAALGHFREEKEGSSKGWGNGVVETVRTRE